MAELILHHFAASPYSEKLRAIFGFKGLAWRSVLQPRVLPKPDLLPLTGGYRRTPVLQIGRDIYCDSRLAVRVIERLAPLPPLLPPSHRASIAAFVTLEPDLFLGGVAANFSADGLKTLVARSGADAVEALMRDRAELFNSGTVRRPRPEQAKTVLLPLLNALDQQLAEQPFVLGDLATLADFIAYHPVWYVNTNEGIRPMLLPFRKLNAWRERIDAFGHGQPIETSAAEAIELARTAVAAQPFEGPLLLPDGLVLGQTVRVQATDYGVDPVEGALVHASVFELAIKREDARAGEVIVHFPRSGFAVSAA
jgi:glutathione S-transferase